MNADVTSRVHRKRRSKTLYYVSTEQSLTGDVSILHKKWPAIVMNAEIDRCVQARQNKERSEELCNSEHCHSTTIPVIELTAVKHHKHKLCVTDNTWSFRETKVRM